MISTIICTVASTLVRPGRQGGAKCLLSGFLDRKWENVATMFSTNTSGRFFLSIVVEGVVGGNTGSAVGSMSSRSINWTEKDNIFLYI